MPRYHFHSYNGHVIMDREGVVLSGQRAARRRAIRLSAAAIESDFAQLPLGEDWRMDVTDGLGRLQLQLHVTVLEFHKECEPVGLQDAAP